MTMLDSSCALSAMASFDSFHLSANFCRIVNKPRLFAESLGGKYVPAKNGFNCGVSNNVDGQPPAPLII